MCGIIGYVGGREASIVLKQGLESLEYRGYDSAGIATKDKTISVMKDIGKISEMEWNLGLLKGNIGIAHTRWATHGGVCRENAHPHLSCDKTIAVVHNGIIENFAVLRKELEKKGHKFASETDSEVIPHLIEENMKKMPFEDAVFQAMQRLKGTFAVVVISSKEEKMIAFKKDSPLVVGLGNKENFVASDAHPFLDYTKKAVFLDDNEAAIMTKDKVEFYDLAKKALVKEPRTIVWDKTKAGKNGHEHYLIKEIYDQPLVLKQTLTQDKAKLEKVAAMIQKASRVYIIGAGTARHAAIVGRYIIGEITGRFCDVQMASEFQYFIDKIEKNSVIIAVSQSGETADVLIPIKKAKEKGCKIVSIVNVMGSSLDRLSDVSLYLNCGPEISVASTKAFTAQVLIFYLLAYTMVYKLDEGKRLLSELPAKIEETIRNTEPEIVKLAEYLKDKSDAYFIARGENFAIAIEGSLKLKEVSYIHAEGMPAGELKHGTLALVSKGVPVIVIAPRDHTHEETIANAHEVKARGGYIIGISDENDSTFDVWLKIPKVDPILYPILTNIPCQLIAYYTAKAKGNDVDKPRNLAKSVTVK
jgi:glucosamine--fructose-6-phosphate aminotransferase (isomerizing)